MRRRDDHRECIASYVDHLLIVSCNPQGTIDALEGGPCESKLKGTEPVGLHLACGSLRDGMGRLCVTKNDHPELDISELPDEDATPTVIE